MPGTVQGTENAAVNKRQKFLYSWGLPSGGGSSNI